MNHYIKIFLCFSLTNYLFLYGYDNYYLVGIEDDYIISSRDQLREYALDLRSELAQNKTEPNSIINQWAIKNKIPTQVFNIEEIRNEKEIYSQIKMNDYAIDLYSDYGPVVLVKIGETEAVEIGPLDYLSIDSTTLQPTYIILHFSLNALIAVLLYFYFKKKSKMVENVLVDVVDRKSISHSSFGEQDVLKSISERILLLDEYIEQIEEHNFQVAIDQKDLMHAVAHELRSPIARFSFALELIEDKQQSQEDKKIMGEMHDSIDELESLIKEILSYSRLSYATTQIKLADVNLTELLIGLTRKLKQLYPQKFFQILNDINELVISADHRYLERALINLLRNAARFATQNINISYLKGDGVVSIYIDDDGIGIPPGKRERIFEAFTRLDPSRSRDSGGVGLGLAIVKKIAEKHGGDVIATDSPSGGARFSLSIPL